MRIGPFLLRLLLCVSLVANGVGLAQAGARMQLAHAAATVQVDAPAAGPQAMAGCHEAAAGDVAMSMPMADSAAASDPVDTATGCCDSDACGCTCTTPGETVFVTMQLAQAGRWPAHRSFDGGTRHRAPRLPHLIRPPIG